MSHGPPPSDSEDDYDGFSVNLVFDDLPPQPQLVGLEERDNFFDKLKQSLTTGNLALLRECFDDAEYLVNVNVQLFQDRTPLLLACQSGSLGCVRFLVLNGAKIHLDCNDTTCLMAACDSSAPPGNIQELVQYLVDMGAPADHQDCNEKTALMIACRKGLIEVVRLLVPHCDLEVRDRWHWTALFHAVDNNRLEIVNILIEKGAETEIADKKGYTLLQVAEMKGFHDIIDLFPKPKEEYIVPLGYLQYSHIGDLVPHALGENPAYFPEIKPILLGSGSEHLIDIFAQKEVTLFELLTMTYPKLAELGVPLPYERKKILHGIYRFHSEPWAKSSLNQINPKGHFDIYDVLTISTTNLKHSTIQLATCCHVLGNHQEFNWDLPSEATIDHTRTQIKALRIRVKELKARVKLVPKENNFMSIDVLKDKAVEPKFLQRLLIYSAAAIGLVVTAKYFYPAKN